MIDVENPTQSSISGQLGALVLVEKNNKEVMETGVLGKRIPDKTLGHVFFGSL